MEGKKREGVGQPDPDFSISSIKASQARSAHRPGLTEERKGKEEERRRRVTRVIFWFSSLAADCPSVITAQQ